MTNNGLSISFQTNKPLHEYGELASAAESYGLETITVYNNMLH
jgi:hypothetical protein